jgi:hypothetical protein
MKSAKDGKPKAAWTYLKAFAMQGGRLPVHHAKSTDTSKHQKQKQALVQGAASRIRDCLTIRCPRSEAITSPVSWRMPTISSRASWDNSRRKFARLTFGISSK